MPKRIPIKTAKLVADMHQFKQVLLIGWDGERVHVVTYGDTKENCAIAAKAQDFWTGKIKEFSFTGDYATNKFCAAGPCSSEKCTATGRCLGL